MRIISSGEILNGITAKASMTFSDVFIQDYIFFRIGFVKLGRLVFQNRFIVAIGGFKTWLIIYDDNIHRNN
jgi:hypothetical protein